MVRADLHFAKQLGLSLKQAGSAAKKSKQFTLRISEGYADKLNALSEEYGVSTGRCLQNLVEFGLDFMSDHPSDLSPRDEGSPLAHESFESRLERLEAAVLNLSEREQANREGSGGGVKVVQTEGESMNVGCSCTGSQGGHGTVPIPSGSSDIESQTGERGRVASKDAVDDGGGRQVIQPSGSLRVIQGTVRKKRGKKRKR